MSAAMNSHWKKKLFVALSVAVGFCVLVAVLVECGGPFSLFGWTLLILVPLATVGLLAYFLPPRMNARAKRLLNWIVAIALVNFFALCAVSLMIGGTAPNGEVTDGKYFLGEHGVYTEVSWGVWLYSYAHCVCVFFTHVSVAAVGFYFWVGGEM